jgi:L-ribulose-5-phosphate 4-epimerase
LNIQLSLTEPSSTEKEGVIKFCLEYRAEPLALSAERLAEFNSWRSLMFKLGLIGQDDRRYTGLAYGNLSRRIEAGRTEFLISGTQTSALELLSASNMSLVTSAVLEANFLSALGLAKPSSEALTHASIYRQSSKAQAVIHVHSPDIWQLTDNLNLARTPKTVAYGTPDMALAVAELLRQPDMETSGIFSMLGHTDGIVAYGQDFKAAADLIIDAWVQAKHLQYQAD